MFKKNFNSFVCDGDTIECVVDGYTVIARLEHDTDSGPPDKMSEGYWPSLDPKAAGYIGNKSKRTLARERARMQEVLDSWNRDEWHYYGVIVNVFKNGVQLTDDYAHATWGIEGNWPIKRKGSNPNTYFREVANDYLPQALKAAKDRIAQLTKETA